MDRDATNREAAGQETAGNGAIDNGTIGNDATDQEMTGQEINASKRAELVSALGELEESKVLEIAQSLLDDGVGIFSLFELLNQGMKKVGALYEEGEYFIADLILSGIIYREVLDLPEMQHSADAGDKLGGILIGTVAGDVHDIGKDIVASTLSANGFSINDLGVDVAADAFVEAVRLAHPDVIALSGTITSSRVYMAETINAIRNEPAFQETPILIGGVCANQEVASSMGADYTTDPMEALAFCKSVVAGQDMHQ